MSAANSWSRREYTRSPVALLANLGRLAVAHQLLSLRHGQKDSTTSTVPSPHVAFHCPPWKLIQFRWPHGPLPTGIRGLSCTHILKSSFSSGTESSILDAADSSEKNDCRSEGGAILTRVREVSMFVAIRVSKAFTSPSTSPPRPNFAGFGPRASTTPDPQRWPISSRRC